MKGRVGLIGVGPISDWHVRALRAAGLEITAVSTRAGSVRLPDFAAQHSISLVFDEWEAMLAEPHHWDALVIATHTDGTPDVLSKALELNIPVLVEKPVGWKSAHLAKLGAQAHAKVMVGFNRRFYRTVQFARECTMKEAPLLAQLCLPEAIDVPREKGAFRPYWEQFFSNSCHGLDILRFVFGSLRIENVHRLRLKTGEIYGLSAILSSFRGDVITLTCNWGAPANFSLSLDRPGRRVELRPFEMVTVYEGMEVIEPSSEVPIRRFLPRVKERVTLEEVDASQKPGFMQQAVAFRGIVEGKSRSPIAATPDDAMEAIKLCEALLGQVHQ